MTKQLTPQQLAEIKALLQPLGYNVIKARKPKTTIRKRLCGIIDECLEARNRPQLKAAQVVDYMRVLLWGNKYPLPDSKMFGRFEYLQSPISIAVVRPNQAYHLPKP